jgi:hypothetical protein
MTGNMATTLESRKFSRSSHLPLRAHHFTAPRVYASR